MVALILTFLGTNVDGFLCLGAVFAVDPPRSRVAAVLASGSGFVLLLGVSLALSLAIGRLGISVAWFGLLPAGIGIARLLRLLFGGKKAGEGDWLSGGASIFSLVLATGADNVAAYTPLFAQRSLVAACSVSLVYLACWMLGNAALVTATPDVHRVRILRRGLEPALAILFVAIGVAIFVQA